MALITPPAPDFSDPLGLLAACHGRMLEHCALLERMLEWLPMHGVDAEIRAATGKVLRYFDVAAPHHHADEEEDLFPRIAGDATLADTIADLQQEHLVLEAAWADLAPHLTSLHEGGVPDGLAPTVRRFLTAYRQHIEIENRVILPRAAELLDAADRAALGRAMAHRRGVSAAASDRTDA